MKQLNFFVCKVQDKLNVLYVEGVGNLSSTTSFFILFGKNVHHGSPLKEAQPVNSKL